MADEPINGDEVPGPGGVALAVLIEAHEDLLIYTTNLREIVQRCYAALNELTASMLEESSDLNFDHYGARGIVVLKQVFHEHEPSTRNFLDVSMDYDNCGDVIRVVYTCQLNANVDALFQANEGLQNRQ